MADSRALWRENMESDRVWDDRERGGERRDRGSGRRRERRNRERPDRGRRERIPKTHDRLEHQSLTQPQTIAIKTPIILTKASAEKVLQQHEAKMSEEPIKISIQKREDVIGSPGSLTSTMIDIPAGVPKILGSDGQESIKILEKSNRPQDEKGEVNVQPIGTPTSQLAGSVGDRCPGLEHLVTGLSSLTTDPTLPKHCFSIVNENFTWSDKALEVLMDQTDFIVVGVAGLQGSGKSAVLSAIAEPRGFLEGSPIFKVQSPSEVEKGQHATSGIDCYITSQRMILLDTQPLFSPSMLERYLKYKKEIPPDYSTSEAYIEMQSLQLLTFLFTVCHVVVVVQDYFTDVSLLKLLKTAEMLKPPTQTSQEGPGGGGTGDELREHVPYLVFCYNRCEANSFIAEQLLKMCIITEKMLQHTNFHITDSASILRSDILPAVATKELAPYRHLNIFLLPEIEDLDQNRGQSKHNIYSKYQGHPSFQLLSLLLHQQLAAMPRGPLTHHTLTEKNWFHYAARTWESVKKSPFLAEYHRLLSS